jgi:UDP-N-acetylglucosamine/UDP-N-acetylgalactosamine diphosphorylase
MIIFFSEFLADVVIPKMSLEYHVAKKKIPMADENGKTFTPSSNSGIKLEAFIFDTFPLSSRMAVLSVPRENEFAPVKNAPGAPVDSPDSACKMLEEEAHLWLRNSVFKEADDNLKGELKALKYLEISPLVSYNGEGLTLDTVKTNFVTGSNVLRLESNAFKSHRGSIPSALRSRFEKANQEHVFKFIDQGNVTAQEAARLIERLSDLDLQALKTIFDRSTGVSDPPTTSLQTMLHSIEPLGDKVVDVLRDTPETVKKDWYHKGVEAISKGQVAALVLGGGQGTRLGFAGPKGMYDIGLPSGTSLFEMFALRVRKAQLLAKNKFPNGKNLIPFIVMTSEMNHEETRSFFQQHSFFGLSPNQVQFFMQGTLPCFTNDGKLILEAPAVLSRASDGNGGIYAALKKSGVLSDLEKKAVQYVHVFSVDNALCKVADPVFVGYCIDQEADCGNKVVWKERPDESVGVFAKRNGEGFAVVEYSEIDKISTELIDPTSGRLLFGAANICNHLYCIDFLKDCCELGVFAEYHVAKKKIPFVNDQGETVVPKENSGIKLETFIFDVFQRATNIKVLVVERQDEFAPVKNAPGASTDSPDTARHLISEQCKRWLLDVNATFDDMTNGLCEVSPLISYNGEGLEEFARKKSPLKLPCVLK